MFGDNAPECCSVWGTDGFTLKKDRCCTYEEWRVKDI